MEICYTKGYTLGEPNTKNANDYNNLMQRMLIQLIGQYLSSLARVINAAADVAVGAVACTGGGAV